MRVISVPEDRSLYPKLVGDTVMAAKLQLGRTRLSVNYNKVPGGILPVLVVDFYNEKGKLYTLRYNLPPDTPERTDRRVSLLMRLIEKEAREEKLAEAV
ncbi:hypothetical protein NS303_18215 [Pantoea ananatis]|uniref:hypothetical protein n=1 Tax=Pantoea ananas TaxID=553 RepID=UPI00073789A8|nr:hypothetical protein [Pantoea ananatis]KTR46816.1 hypothetical protein NS303_18215 [Pantoea ananatis]KTR53996.1 hypothetical protein NS311_17590 [Pantoea ananatis]KTR66742.1 hypothetical protein RSA47_01820 [Pantoea ananatis]KTR71294.1 hypothetical protein NS296_07120 [Pantoea ananatis]MCW0350629.1 hypothetical protein [Pantoea ananatis]